MACMIERLGLRSACASHAPFGASPNGIENSINRVSCGGAGNSTRGRVRSPEPLNA